MTHPPRYLYVPGAPSLRDRLHGVLGVEGEDSLFVGGEWGKCWTVRVEEGDVSMRDKNNYFNGIKHNDLNLRLPGYEGDLSVC